MYETYNYDLCYSIYGKYSDRCFCSGISEDEGARCDFHPCDVCSFTSTEERPRMDGDVTMAARFVIASEQCEMLRDSLYLFRYLYYFSYPQIPCLSV